MTQMNPLQIKECSKRMMPTNSNSHIPDPNTEAENIPDPNNKAENISGAKKGVDETVRIMDNHANKGAEHNNDSIEKEQEGAYNLRNHDTLKAPTKDQSSPWATP